MGEYNCEYEKEYGDCANCENADDDEQEEEEDQFENLREFAECQNLEIEDDNRRRLDEDEVEYFVGAYCSESGSSIHLGVFTDDTCSQFADEYGGSNTYMQLTYGKSLPYSDTTMIGTECMSCKEPQDADQNNNNDQEDEDEVKESCEQLYEGAGKCEYGLDIQYPNNYGCNFMEGIKIVRKNGTIVSGPGSKSTTASVFVGLFAASFVLLGGYAYYLKTKLDRAKVNLVSEE